MTLVWLVSGRGVGAVGVGGDQEQVQSEREAVMAQTEQFMLRMGTYGPDLLDDKGAMPEYRQRVEDVITPKFAVSFEKEATTAEQIVAQAQISRQASVFATGVSAIDDDSATALVAGAFTDSYPKTGAREPAPFRIEVSLVKVEGRVARRQLHPGDGSPASEHRSDATPSWYDVLDVAPDASEKEIRAAWKSAIADLDPSDRRFRVLNQAAEVLLDRKARKAYDAELATEDDAADEPGTETAEAAASPRRTGWVPPGWLLLAVAAVTALVVGACAVLAVTVPSDASVADATRQAQAAAERAIVPVLSYDASDMKGSQQAAEAYLTADYRDQYDRLFAVLEENAGRTGTVVTAEVVASALVRSGDDRVSVLLFVNRPTTNKKVTEPVVYKDQVTVTMQKVGDSWLIDDLVTSPAA